MTVMEGDIIKESEKIPPSKDTGDPGAAKQKIDTSPEGWTYLELPSSHVPMADMPEALFRILRNIAKS